MISQLNFQMFLLCTHIQMRDDLNVCSPLLDFYSSYMWFIQVSRECWTAHLNYRLSRFYKRKSNRLWRMLCSVGDGHDGSLSSLRYIFRCRGTEITVREGSKREKKSIVGVNGLRMILSLTFSF